MLMEKERVQSTKIREMLNNSEIKYINCFVPLKEVITEEMINQMMKYYEIDEKDKIVD
jgi:FAD synthase